MWTKKSTVLNDAEKWLLIPVFEKLENAVHFYTSDKKLVTSQQSPVKNCIVWAAHP